MLILVTPKVFITEEKQPPKKTAVHIACHRFGNIAKEVIQPLILQNYIAIVI